MLSSLKRSLLLEMKIMIPATLISKMLSVLCLVFPLYLPTVLQAFRAVHHNVDFGVGPGTPDVSCHNLDIVHNT